MEKTFGKSLANQKRICYNFLEIHTPCCGKIGADFLGSSFFHLSKFYQSDRRMASGAVPLDLKHRRRY